MRTASSDSARSSHDPCLGVYTHSKRWTRRRASGRWEGLVERRLGVDIQVVLEQRDQVLACGKVVVGDVP